MKHLKLYENLVSKKFWLISNKVGEYELSLDILGVDKESNFYSFDRLPSDGYKVYIAIITNGNATNYEWNLADRSGYVWFIDNNYEYMGELKITDVMKNQIKYNL